VQDTTYETAQNAIIFILTLARFLPLMSKYSPQQLVL